MRGDGSIYRRGNIWWIKFYRDGKQVFMSCKGLTEDQARIKLRRELRKSDEEFVEPRTKRVTIADLMENLFTHYEANGLDTYRKMAKAKWETYLKAEFERVKAHTFGTEHQLRYRNKRLKEDAANATINREFQILRRAFTLGLEHEPPLVKRVPKFKITKEENARQGFVTTAQMEALKAAALKEGFDYRVLLEMAHLLGWRKGELLNLHVANVRLADNSIRLEADETKNGRGRDVPLSQSLRTLLEPLVLGRKSEDKLFKFVDIRKAWARITKAAGCPEILFHDLRRTSARSKRAAGVDSSVIMEMQGWLTDAVFRRYAIVATDDKIDALAKQEAYEKQVQAEAAALAKKQQEAAETEQLQNSYIPAKN
jgi:integrase